MSDKITLDRETFKTLAADTRIEILKRLSEHKMTLTDLAESMNLSASTVKEHLDKLISADLIKQEDRGMKWKYYSLTFKGRYIITPTEMKVWILLSIVSVGLIGVTARLLTEIKRLVVAGGGIEEAAMTLQAAPQKEAAKRASDVAFEKAPEAVSKAAESSGIVQSPYLEVFAAIFLALAAGVCVGYIVRKKRKKKLKINEEELAK